MKQFSRPAALILVMTLFSFAAFAQVKVPQKETPKQTTPVKQTPVKTAEVKPVSSGPVQILKVTSNVDCNFYVDNELKGTLKQDDILKISLKTGEYQFKAVSLANPADIKREIYTVDKTGIEKFYNINLQEIKEAELRAKQSEMLIKSGFKFSDEAHYEMGTIKGQNGECKVESFVGGQSAVDNYAYTSLKINKSEYWGGECKDGYLNGLVLMTVYGDKNPYKQNILAYFVMGRVTYPFLDTFVSDDNELFIGINESDVSYGCLYVGSENNWNAVDERQMCVNMKEIYGEQIFSLDFMRNFKHGNIDLKELEKKFNDFITSGKKITRG